MALTAIYPNGVVEYKLKPAGYARLKDSIEIYGVDRTTKNERENGKPPRIEDKSSPDVFNFETGERERHVTLTKDIQEWMFRCMVEYWQGWQFRTDSEWLDWLDHNRKGQLAGWVTSVLRSNGSHTNKSAFGQMFASIPDHANWIKLENLDNGLPKFFYISTGRWVGEMPNENTARFAGVAHYGFKCINISKGYKQFHPFTHPQLFDRPMITGRDMVIDKSGLRITGHWRAPYGQFDNRLVFPVMSQTKDIAWFPVQNVKLNSEIAPLRKFG